MGSDPAPPPAARLAFAVQPHDAFSGIAISPAVKVVVRDANDATVTSSTAAITLSLGANPGGATLSGTRTMSAVAGVATFSNLILDNAASGYSLVASSPGLSPATSAAFDLAPPPPVVAKTAANNGDAQSDTVGATLPAPLRVVVRQNGVLQSGLMVVWASSVPGATLTPSGPTNAGGIATATWRLGTLAGNQSATASVSGAAGSPVTFSATAQPGSATQLTKVAGDLQSAPVNTPLPQALQAKVADQYNNGIGATTVHWEVTSGAASLAAPDTPTNSSGIASASVTLGGSQGPIIITATSGSLAAVTFGATATPPSTRVTVNLTSQDTFDPSSLTIAPGTTVDFVWQGPNHNVVSDGPQAFTGSGVPNDPPRTYSVTFNAAGTYNYHCSAHGAPGVGMHGTITVQ